VVLFYVTILIDYTPVTGAVVWLRYVHGGILRFGGFAIYGYVLRDLRYVALPLRTVC